jgi:thiol peroxidase
MKERKGAVTSNGQPQTVIGEALKEGDKAPDFRLLAGDGSARTLRDFEGKPLLVNVVTSLDTGICDAQSRRFDQEALKLKGKVNFITVSADLPTAQKRWCNEAAAETIQVLSDHYDMNFGNAWGTHVKELRLEQRSVFVVDASGVVRYVQYVPEIAQHPEYDDVLAALQKVVG